MLLFDVIRKVHQLSANGKELKDIARSSILNSFTANDAR